MKETTKFIAILLAGCTMLSLGVGFVDKKVKENHYGVCKKKMVEIYNDDWKSTCKNLGKNEDCQLNGLTAGILKESLKSDLAYCQKELEIMKK